MDSSTPATPANPVPPIYVLPPVNVVQMGDANAAMTQTFSQVWGLAYDAGNHGLVLQGVSGGVGTIVAGDLREAEPEVAESVMAIHQSVLLPSFEAMMEESGIVSEWSVVAAEIVGLSGVIHVVGLNIRVIEMLPGHPQPSPAQLAGVGNGVFTPLSLTNSAAESVALSLALSAGLEGNLQPPAPSPVLPPAWAPYPSEAACMNAQRATQDLCIDAAFVDSLLCARNAIAGAALAFAGCITLSVALPVIGWGICLAVAAATYAGWMALCLIDYMVKVNACRLRFLQDALLFCGVYIAWI